MQTHTTSPILVTASAESQSLSELLSYTAARLKAGQITSRDALASIHRALDSPDAIPANHAPVLPTASPGRLSEEEAIVALENLVAEMDAYLADYDAGRV